MTLPQPSYRFSAAACAAVMALPLTACTSVHIHTEGDASARTSYHLGLAIVILDTGRHGALVYRSSGLGAARTPTGTTLGYWKETSALFATESECRTVIWAGSTGQLAEIRRLLAANGGSLATLCFVNTGERR